MYRGFKIVKTSQNFARVTLVLIRKNFEQPLQTNTPADHKKNDNLKSDVYRGINLAGALGEPTVKPPQL